MKHCLTSLVLSFCCFLQSAIAKESPVSSTYLGSREGDPASLVENVSTIHGDYTEVESDSVYHSFRSTITTGLEIGSLVVGGYGAVKGVIGFSKLAKAPIQLAKMTKAVSSLPSNPLQGTKYTRKVLLQMENNLKTGKPDLHGFPKIVDNYAGLGRRELIKGKDGISRMKISLEGGYKG
jgi:hypothetical protein